jgi:antagonist of KipI
VDGEFERRRAYLETAAPAESGGSPGRPLFRVEAPGVFTSVQGGPRHGGAIYGVPPGGAMDAAALASGNALLGNPPSAPGLEITLVGPELEALHEASVALSGAGLEARLNERPIEAATIHAIRAGDRLRFGPLRGAARAYLCVAGGLTRGTRLEPPRRLVSGDTVYSSVRHAPGRDSRGRGPHSIEAGDEIRIRVLPGPQWDRFEPRALETFLGGLYRVSASSDRRGIRLDGPALSCLGRSDIPPEGTPLGAIQVPSDGRPIILGPDRPVTGGYAKIATVASADFPLLGRALPGTAVRFAEVSLAEAVAARPGGRE